VAPRHAEVEKLKALLGEAHVELRVWKTWSPVSLTATRPSVDGEQRDAFHFESAPLTEGIPVVAVDDNTRRGRILPPLRRRLPLADNRDRSQC
jgi:hypothetical protein